MDNISSIERHIEALRNKLVKLGKKEINFVNQRLVGSEQHQEVLRKIVETQEEIGRLSNQS
jgi:intergrase/recombinase